MQSEKFQKLQMEQLKHIGRYSSEHPKMENDIFYTEGTSDASLAEDKNGRLRVVGYTLSFGGAPIGTNQN
jgi:hypothetical protein